jgi:hypothetical protein
MPFDDPAALDLRALFRDAGMFDSRRAWGAAGFHVLDRANNGKIMVATHPSARGLLFKKYSNDLEQRDQRKNYERRIEGASRLRAFVDKQPLSRVVVPRKWLLELPHPLSRKEEAHVLVVEQLDLLSDEQTKVSYQRIDLGLLKELCTMLFHFRGMDSNAKNLPFVADGRIAFIDTEHWDRGTSKAYLHHVGAHMSTERRKIAKKIFEQLEDGGDVALGDYAYEEDGRRDFDDENTSDSSDSSDSSADDDNDFDDEDDTSASSSSS